MDAVQFVVMFATVVSLVCCLAPTASTTRLDQMVAVLMAVVMLSMTMGGPTALTQSGAVGLTVVCLVALVRRVRSGGSAVDVDTHRIAGGLVMALMVGAHAWAASLVDGSTGAETSGEMPGMSMHHGMYHPMASSPSHAGLITELSVALVVAYVVWVGWNLLRRGPGQSGLLRTEHGGMAVGMGLMLFVGGV